MKSKTMKELAALTEARWGGEQAGRIAADAAVRWEQLCREHRGACREKQAHFREELFPCISYYEALQKNGVPRQEALAFLDRSWSDRARVGAARTKRMLGCCGLYRLYPAMFQWVARHQFGEKAGFAATFYDCGRSRCRFDMTKCLFWDTCRSCGCPELTACFCHTDDINNADLHPKLSWSRTQFLGGGGTLCDFDVAVRKD